MPDPATNAPEHILVIDDDRDIREDLRAYLTENGYRVSTAENAPAARRAIHSEEPDLILLDVMMLRRGRDQSVSFNCPSYFYPNSVH